MCKRYSFISVFLICMIIFSGCGEKEELTIFKDEMDNFYTQIFNIEADMHEIEEEDENSLDSLLFSLEEMSVQFEKLAELEVPEEFISIEELADDASDYMNEAVRLYSEAYEEDYVSDSLIQAAIENYDSAMKRINYIAILLQGEIPEGATIVEGEGNEFVPYSEE